MKFTNHQGFPKALENMLAYSDYNSSGARFDISATKLLGSSLIAELWRKHGKEVEQDVGDNIWSSAGSGIHSRLEVANANDPNIICEKRFMGVELHPITKESLTISAQIDVLDLTTNTLADLKSCSAWKLVMGSDTDWTNQLNIQAYLARKSGWVIDHVVVYALARDWARFKAGEKDYPLGPLTVVPLKLWSYEQQKEYVTERLAEHFGDREKRCTDVERWMKAGSFAVKDKTKKRALRVAGLDTKAKAVSWIKSQGLDGNDSIFIEERPKKYTRCDDFCAFGKQGLCPQLEQERINGSS